MKAIRTFVHNYTLVVFFSLAFAFTWWLNLVESHSMFALGPLMAALIVLAITSGWSGVRDFLRRIGQWRVGLQWYAVAIGLPVALIGATIGLNVLLGAQRAAPQPAAPLSDMVATALFILIAVGLGEEPAWRGFALPRLMVGRSALSATLVLAVIHAFWHLPLFGLEYNAQNGVPWFILLVSSAVVFTWVVQNTRGSLLLPVLMHTSQNVAGKYLFNSAFSGSDMIQGWWLLAVLWGIVAVVIVLATGTNLVRSNSATTSFPYAGQPVGAK